MTYYKTSDSSGVGGSAHALGVCSIQFAVTVVIVSLFSVTLTLW